MGVRETTREILGRHMLFKHLAADDLDRLAALAHPRTYAGGQAVFLKDDPGSSLMAVLSGRIRICTHALDGREIVLNVMIPGEIFGEIALLDGGPRTASAYADEPSVLIVMDRNDFFGYLRRTPSASSRLVEAVCGRLRWVSQQFEDLIFLDLSTRLAKRLLYLADTCGENGQGGKPVRIRVTQQTLACMMGSARQVVNRQLRGYEARGLIKTRRGAIDILDRAKLERVAGGEA